MSLSSDLKKPLDKGFKRNLIIIGGAIGISIAVIFAITYFASADKPVSTAAETKLRQVLPSESGGEPVNSISPAMAEKLARVQDEEAKAARREGRSYIPESTLGQGTAVKQPEAPAPEPQGPGQSGYVQYGARGREVTGNQIQSDPNAQLASQREMIQAGLELQLAMIAYTFERAETASVEIKEVKVAAETNGAQGQGAMGTNAAYNASQGAMLFPGLRIAPGRLESPLNTDKTRYASATITAGPLAGAFLIGQSTPMTLSGDVEDVSVQLTQMRFRDKVYQIDAIVLNEQTSADMLEADVDRHFVSKQVMPVIMAGLSGLSTFFTAQGQTGVSYSPTGFGGDNIIVDQPKANREEARQQGIGDAIEKVVQNGERQVDKMSQRPNTATLPAFTTVGILFRQPVFEQTVAR